MDKFNLWDLVEKVAQGKNNFNLEHYQEAITSFTEVIELTPEDDQNIDMVEIYFFRAKSYYELRNLDEAVNDINKAIELNPDISLNYYYKAKYLFIMSFEEDFSFYNVDFNDKLGLKDYLSQEYSSDLIKLNGCFDFCNKAIETCDEVLNFNSYFEIYDATFSLKELIIMEQKKLKFQKEYLNLLNLSNL